MSEERRAKSEEQRAKSKERRAKSKERRAKSKELIAESEEQKAIGREFYPLRSTLCALCFFFLCSMLFAFCFFASVAEAKMKGRCKDCHSMHADTPFPVLTKGGCVGCHGQVPDGTQNIITIGKARIPQILHHMRDGDFASGNFYYVADGYNPDYTKGHNVTGISHQESIPTMNIPPGFIGNVVIPGGKGPEYWPNEQVLTCSGTWGCHGNRTIEDPYLSLYRAHHTHNSEIDGLTVGKSYRFLYGITGVEHPNWEYLATKDDHNGYKGDFNHNTIDTISYLCGECHGKFHPNPNLGGSKEVGFANFIVWRRHPADISFSTVHGGFAGSEYQGYVTYSLESPVAYLNPTGKEKVVDADSILMCLSCHRAHASNYSDALRWDYSKITDGSTQKEGCLICHTNKGGHQ